MDAAAGQANLPRMIAQVLGAFDEDDPVRRFAEDSDRDGGGAAHFPMITQPKAAVERRRTVQA